MAKVITGVSLYKMVKMEVYYDVGDFDTEEEFLDFVQKVTGDKEEANEAFDNGETDCGSDDSLDDYKTYVEHQFQEGEDTTYVLTNPDNDGSKPA